MFPTCSDEGRTTRTAAGASPPGTVDAPRTTLLVRRDLAPAKHLAHREPGVHLEREQRARRRLHRASTRGRVERMKAGRRQTSAGIVGGRQAGTHARTVAGHSESPRPYLREGQVPQTGEILPERGVLRPRRVGALFQSGMPRRGADVSPPPRGGARSPPSRRKRARSHLCSDVKNSCLCRASALTGSFTMYSCRAAETGERARDARSSEGRGSGLSGSSRCREDTLAPQHTSRGARSTHPRATRATRAPGPDHPRSRPLRSAVTHLVLLHHVRDELVRRGAAGGVLEHLLVRLLGGSPQRGEPRSHGRRRRPSPSLSLPPGEASDAARPDRTRGVY